MSDCVSSSPLSLSVTRQLGFLSTSGRSFTSAIRCPHNVISHPRRHLSHGYFLSFTCGALRRSSKDGPYREVGFREDDSGDESVRSGKSLNFDQQERGGEAANVEGKDSGTLPLRNAGEGDLVQVEGKGNGELKMRGGRQVMRRSSLMAKQVISMSSALSLGFVSQLWVDTATVSEIVFLPLKLLKIQYLEKFMNLVPVLAFGLMVLSSVE